MFNRRKEQARGTTCLDSDPVVGFALGSSLTLAMVLIVNLLLPTHRVEHRVLEAARQALHGIPLPP